MSVTIITGAIGAGKTRYCIDQIKKMHKAYPQNRMIMLVPPHYSHVTEHMLISEFGGTGINNIECTSMEKLARELLTGAEKKLGASGKNALICRAISLMLENIDVDKFDRKIIRAVCKDGFVDVCASLISEMHRYNITSEMLYDESEATDNPLLSQKLEILSSIYQQYAMLLENTDYIDSDDDLSRLAGVIDTAFNSGDYIWIDKFDELLPQQLDVIYALINVGVNITITFNVCNDSDDTYYGTKKAISDI